MPSAIIAFGVTARKRTYRDPESLFPTSVLLTLTDASGRDHELLGEVTAAANWRVWHHSEGIFCSIRWTLRTASDEWIGQGDLQAFQRFDYIRAFTGDPSGAIAARA